jgi:hypothetical protein
MDAIPVELDFMKPLFAFVRSRFEGGELGLDESLSADDLPVRTRLAIASRTQIYQRQSWQPVSRESRASNGYLRKGEGEMSERLETLKKRVIA